MWHGVSRCRSCSKACAFPQACLTVATGVNGAHGSSTGPEAFQDCARALLHQVANSHAINSKYMRRAFAQASMFGRSFTDARAGATGLPPSSHTWVSTPHQLRSTQRRLRQLSCPVHVDHADDIARHLAGIWLGKRWRWKATTRCVVQGKARP